MDQAVIHWAWPMMGSITISLRRTRCASLRFRLMPSDTPKWPMRQWVLSNCATMPLNASAPILPVERLAKYVPGTRRAMAYELVTPTGGGGGAGAESVVAFKCVLTDVASASLFN